MTFDESPWQEAREKILRIDDEICEHFKQQVWYICVKNGVPSSTIKKAFAEIMESVEKKEAICGHE